MFWWAALFFMYSQAAQNKIVFQKQHLMANFVLLVIKKNAVNQISVSNKMLPWKTYV